MKFQEHRNAISKNDGSPLTSFSQLTKFYINQTSNQYHIDTINRHFLPFWEQYQDINQIRLKDVNAYVLHRKSKSHVSPNTLNKENCVFNQMMRFALENEWMMRTIKIKKEKSIRNTRSNFTEKEYMELIKHSRARVSEFNPKTSKKQYSGLLTMQYWQRALLHDIIIILANTGLRVDEIKHVTWRDVNFDERSITLRGVGKVKSWRKVGIRGRYGIRALQRIRERRLELINDEKLLTNERIQSLPNGLFTKSLSRGFRRLVDSMEYPLSENDRSKYVLTSLRHTYATLRLQNDTPTRALSKQMGTSERMIEYHYGHDTVDDYWEHLIN